MLPNTTITTIQSITKNCIPVIGVLFFGWSAVTILFVYYFETLISEIFYFRSLKLNPNLKPTDFPERLEKHLPITIKPTEKQDISQYKDTILRSMRFSSLYTNILLITLFGLAISSHLVSINEIIFASLVVSLNQIAWNISKRNTTQELLRRFKTSQRNVAIGGIAIILAIYCFGVLLKLTFIPILGITVTVVAVANLLFDTRGAGTPKQPLS